MINISTKTAFAWCLLVSTIKAVKMPPRFRGPNDVKQITAMSGMVDCLFYIIYIFS